MTKPRPSNDEFSREIPHLKVHKIENFFGSEFEFCTISVFSYLAGMSPYISLKNKEKTLRASYDRGTQIFDYMD
jgi:hypothetical protein